MAKGNQLQTYSRQRDQACKGASKQDNALLLAQSRSKNTLATLCLCQVGIDLACITDHQLYHNHLEEQHPAEKWKPSSAVMHLQRMVVSLKFN